MICPAPAVPDEYRINILDHIEHIDPILMPHRFYRVADLLCFAIVQGKREWSKRIGIHVVRIVVPTARLLWNTNDNQGELCIARGWYSHSSILNN